MKTQRLVVASLVGVLLASSAPIANAKRRRQSGGGHDGKGGSGHGKPYEVWAAPQPPPPPTPPQVIELKPPTAGEKYNYAQLMSLSLLYYEAQRSGPLPANNRIPWRRDANVDDPVPGGWYDAGDFIKFSWTNAYAATVIAWGFLEWSDAYEKAGETENLYACIRWPLDFLLKAHTGATEFVVQVGDAIVEHSYWGRPELETLPRPATKVDVRHAGTEPPAEAAAAMAAGFLVFKDHDPAYAEELLLHARRLFDFAYKHQAMCQVSAPYYQSTGFIDELAYAAAWLYKATGEKAYLEAATGFAHKMNDVTSAFSWENKSAGVSLLMYKLTGDVTYKERFTTFMKNFKQASPKTPHGLHYYQEWGVLRYAANTAFLALLAADLGIDAKANRQFARSQIHYIVGENGNGSGGGFSYIIGFNKRYPKAPHHRTASCGQQGCICTTEPSAFTVYGALVGGPDSNDQYRDDCENYKQAEVAIDYNAGFQSAVAGLKHLSNMGLLASF